MLDLNAGALRPVDDEVVISDLRVTGTIPHELNGTLIRNGPNPLNGRFDGEGMLNWWIAPAMFHGVSLSDGRAASYRNRWARTGNWNRFVDPTTSPDPLMDQNVNVNIIRHANRILALGEGGLPFEITTELHTVGPTTFDGALTPPAMRASVSNSTAGPGGMTAHPKIDPITGELAYFRADWQEPYLRYGVLDHKGQHVVDQIVEVPGPGMMHDFAVTETKAIFLDLPVAYDFSMLQLGAPMPLRWHDERVARVGIMARNGGDATWVEIEPCFIQHVVNAYDIDPNRVVLDVVRYDSFLRFDASTATFAPNPLGQVWRYEIRVDGKETSVTETRITDAFVEMPRINEAFVGRKHRYVYLVEQPTDVEMRGIIKLDVASGHLERHDVPGGDQNLEPVYVPRRSSMPDLSRPAGMAEDDGWVLACVYRAESDTTDVMILDAQNIAGQPVATVHLPRRIPAGFHGQWLQGADN